MGDKTKEHWLRFFKNGSRFYQENTSWLVVLVVSLISLAISSGILFIICSGWLNS